MYLIISWSGIKLWIISVICLEFIIIRWKENYSIGGLWYVVKVVCIVWIGGKVRDNFKDLFIDNRRKMICKIEEWKNGDCLLLCLSNIEDYRKW